GRVRLLEVVVEHADEVALVVGFRVGPDEVGVVVGGNVDLFLLLREKGAGQRELDQRHQAGELEHDRPSSRTKVTYAQETVQLWTFLQNRSLGVGPISRASSWRPMRIRRVSEASTES